MIDPTLFQYIIVPEQLKIKDHLLWPIRDNTNTASLIIRDWEEHGHMYIGAAKKKSLIVQAGGCCGLYPLLFAQHFDTVVTFEPDPVNFYCLAHNCKQANIVKFNTAITDQTGFYSMAAYNINVGMSRIVPPNSPHLQHTLETRAIVYGINIDGLNLPSCDLIQFDLEGFELFALQGAQKTIDKFRPPIFLERNPDPTADNNPEVAGWVIENKYVDIGTYGYDHYYVPKEDTLSSSK